jgi:hypothetical protein
MRDPYVHVEKMPVPGFGNAQMRQVIIQATHGNWVPDLPKTVGTGCGRRRLMVMTSTVPEKVTCLPCREYAHDTYLRAAQSAESLLDWNEREPTMVDSACKQAKISLDDLIVIARDDREMAARYAS